MSKIEINTYNVIRKSKEIESITSNLIEELTDQQEYLSNAIESFYDEGITGTLNQIYENSISITESLRKSLETTSEFLSSQIQKYSDENEEFVTSLKVILSGMRDACDVIHSKCEITLPTN